MRRAEEDDGRESRAYREHEEGLTTPSQLEEEASAIQRQYHYHSQRPAMLQSLRGGAAAGDGLRDPNRQTGRESAPLFGATPYTTTTTTANSAGNSPMIVSRQGTKVGDRIRREMNPYATAQPIDDDRIGIVYRYDEMPYGVGDAAELERKGIYPPTTWPEWGDERQSVGMPPYQRYSLRSADSGFPVDPIDDSSRPTSPNAAADGVFASWSTRGGEISPREGRQMLRTAQRAISTGTNPGDEYGTGTGLLDRLSESPRSSIASVSRSESIRSWQQQQQQQGGASPEPNRPIPGVRRSESMRAYFAGESPRETRVRRNESIRSAGVMTPTADMTGGGTNWRNSGLGIQSAGGSQTPTAAFEARARRVSRNGSLRTETGTVTPTSQLGRRESLRSARGVSPPINGVRSTPKIRQMPPPPPYLGGNDVDPNRTAVSPNPMRLSLAAAAGTSTPVAAQSPADPPPYFALAFNPVVVTHSPMNFSERSVARRTPQGVPYVQEGGRQTPRQSSSRPSSPGNVTSVSRSNSTRSGAGSRGPTPSDPPPYHNPRTTPPIYKEPLTTQRTTPVQQQPLAIDYYIGPSPGPLIATREYSTDPPPYVVVDDLNQLPDGTYSTRYRRTKPKFMERDSPSPSILEEEEDARPYKGAIVLPEAYKFYMEQHVENVIKRRKEREERRMNLERRMAQMDLSEERRDQMLQLLYQKESNYLRLKRARIHRSQFTHISILGRGGFAEVSLVRKNDTDELYAMKTLKKAEVIKRNQVAHVKAERDILAEADNDWVVKLFFSFQDQENLYFIMDYIPGGDMLSLLVKLGRFTEPMAIFYIAELVLAIDSVHKMGFIHRDIKPDNILIDRDGHIKLTDFGLCTGFRWTHDSKYYKPNHPRQDSMEPAPGAWEWLRRMHNVDLSKPLERRAFRQAQRRNEAHSVVGTPNYIAPEVLLGEGYAQLCDWWSVGVILYEMVFGQPPFLSPTPRETQVKIINFERTLYFPDDLGVSANVVDLIQCLCCHQQDRLDVNGIVMHSVFCDIDWQHLRSTEAPYVPRLSSATDTSNFDDATTAISGEAEAAVVAGATVDASGKMGGVPDLSNAPAFYEFTFRRFYHDNKGHPVKAPMKASVIYV